MDELKAENEKLRALLNEVLKANIAQGCKPEHPRVSLVGRIIRAVYRG